MRLNKILRNKIKSAVEADVRKSTKDKLIDIQELIYQDSLLSFNVIFQEDFSKDNLQTFRKNRFFHNYYYYFNKNYKPYDSFVSTIKNLEEQNNNTREIEKEKFNIDSIDAILLGYTTVESLILEYPRFKKYVSEIIK